MTVGRIVRAAALLMVLVGSTACDASVIPSPATSGTHAATVSPTAEPTPTVPIGAPLAAFFFLRGMPPTAAIPVEIVVHGRDDPALGTMAFKFRSGEAILASEAIGPGAYGVAANGIDCDGDMMLVAEMETDAVVMLAGDACTLSPEDAHPAGAAHTGGAIAGELPHDLVGRAVVALISDDAPPNPVPESIEVDESGRFFFPSLQPGRYRVTVLVDGVTAAVRDVELAPGQSEFIAAFGEGSG